MLFAWRGERQEPLVDESDFSLWNDDEPFRPNVVAHDGRLNAVVVGASVDSRGFDHESLEATYRRHQLETPFGERLNDLDREARPVADVAHRLDVGDLDAGRFDSDFDFRRHIVSGRARFALSPHQNFGVRAIGGWSDGVLPPQRQFGDRRHRIGARLRLQAGGRRLDGARQSRILARLAQRAEGVRLLRRRPRQPVGARRADAPWLNGVGWGIGVGDVRVDFGYKVDDIPSSLQVLSALGRTFLIITHAACALLAHSVVAFLLAYACAGARRPGEGCARAGHDRPATIECAMCVPDRFRKMLDSGGVLHLRVQAELWESRPVWDRLVYPAIIRVFRLVRAASGGELSITDTPARRRAMPPCPIRCRSQLDLGHRRSHHASQKYYVHVVVTLGTLAEREVDAVGDAVFGRESEANGLGSLGRLVFRTVLQVSDYLQSVTSETRSRKLSGADLLK